MQKLGLQSSRIKKLKDHRCALQLSCSSFFIVLFFLHFDGPLIYSAPPLSVFYDPHLQTMCCYIARYYVKIMHMCLGIIKHIFLLSWAAETE